MLWLDLLIFGNGRGLGAPYFDQAFYRLVDTRFGRKGGSAAWYTWIGGHGAQIMSRQWFHPLPGEKRRLVDREFIVFQSHRRGLRVEVSWTMRQMSGKNIVEANTLTAFLKRDLHA